MTSTVRDICRSLFGHSTFFVASLVFMKSVKSDAVYARTVHVGNSSVPPRPSAVFVERTRSLSFDFKFGILTVGLRMMQQRERQI